MDTITQAAFGAVVAQVGFTHKLGKKALIWGTLAGLAPDFDMMMTVPFGEWAECLYHRGPTHSLFFGPVVGPLLGWLTWKWYARGGNEAETRSDLPYWIGLWVVGLFTHPLLDLFTRYGTQLGWPLTSHRYAIPGMAIIDPFYSGWLFIALILGGVWRANPMRYRSAAAAAIAISSVYALFAWNVNHRAELEVEHQLAHTEHAHAEVRAYPTMFQPFLRRVVASEPEQVRVGFISMWEPHPVEWGTHRRLRHPALDAARETEEYAIFHWFAHGQLAARIETNPDGSRLLLIDDIRYGFPGHPSHGLWGAGVPISPAGKLLGRLRRYRHPFPENTAEGLSDLFRRAFALR